LKIKDTNLPQFSEAEARILLLLTTLLMKENGVLKCPAPTEVEISEDKFQCLLTNYNYDTLRNLFMPCVLKIHTVKMINTAVLT
jgi:hypothetical protein